METTNGKKLPRRAKWIPYDLLDIFPNGLEEVLLVWEVRENHRTAMVLFIYTYIMYRYILLYCCVRLLKIILDHF